MTSRCRPCNDRLSRRPLRPLRLQFVLLLFGLTVAQADAGAAPVPKHQQQQHVTPGGDSAPMATPFAPPPPPRLLCPSSVDTSACPCYKFDDGKDLFEYTKLMSICKCVLIKCKQQFD